MKKLEIEKTKPTFIICTSFNTWILGTVALVTPIFYLLSNKITPANKYIDEEKIPSRSNSALALLKMFVPTVKLPKNVSKDIFHSDSNQFL